MATLTLHRRGFDFGLPVDPDDDRITGVPGDRGGLTLDELLVSAWEGLRDDHTAACPVCGEAMAPRFGPGHRPVGGRCGSCASVLS